MSNICSNADFPPLFKNKAAHDVKADVCRVEGSVDDKAHIGAVGSVDDKGHIGATVGSAEKDKVHAVVRQIGIGNVESTRA